MTEALIAITALLALVLAYVNGFHDASNAVSTTITTRALRESTALTAAALLNLLGALLGIGLVGLTSAWGLRTLGLPGVSDGATAGSATLGTLLFAAVLATVAWDIFTWWLGMPSSTWHALFGGIAGASVVVGWDTPWFSSFLTALLPTAFLPLLAALTAYLMLHVVSRLMAGERVRPAHLRFAQTMSGGSVAAVHGIQDAQIPMAVIVVLASTTALPGSVLTAAGLLIAVSLAAGTLMGGYRIIRTIGSRMTDLSTAQGFSAETSAATLMSVVSLGLGTPVSSSHALASGVIGAGLAMGPRALRWRVVARMVLTWVATPVMTFLLAATISLVVIGVS